MTTEQERITGELNDDVRALIAEFRQADSAWAAAMESADWAWESADISADEHRRHVTLVAEAKAAFFEASMRLALAVANAIERDGYRLAPPAPAAPVPAPARPAPTFNPRSASTRVKAQPSRLRLTTQQRAALEELRRERIAIHSDKPNRTLQSLIDKGLVYCGYQRRIDGLGPAEWRLSLTEDGRAALRGRS